MIRLVLSDLRDNAAIWIGAFIIAVTCGYIGGWCTSIEATSATYKNLQNFSIMVLIFSCIAAVPVLASASNLTVSVQKRSYALWQLANLSPRQVSAIVLCQLVVVAMLGAVIGTLLEALSFFPLFPWVFSSYAPPENVVPSVGEWLMPLAWLIVVGVFLIGGLRGALHAGKTPPLTALRESASERVGITWMRVVLFVVLAFATVLFAILITDTKPGTGLQFTLVSPILVAATMVSLAPLLCSILLKAWTSLVPQTRWNAWYIARRSALYSLDTSTSVETPIIIGFALIAGTFSLSSTMDSYVLQQNMTGYSTTLDWTSSLLMLGGPVLLCAVGAAVSVVMSARSRSRDVALLVACGARAQTLVIAALCEAFMHALTATLLGMVCVIISNVIIAHAVHLPLFSTLVFGQGFVISLLGFALLFLTTLIPTLVALSHEPATALTVQE